MPEPSLPLPSDDPADDLPRTFRRERDARAREAREREEAARARAQAGAAPAADSMPPAATVTHIDIPFARLVIFFLKAAVAATPAILLFGIILLLAGQVLSPLVHIRIEIPPPAAVSK